MPAIFLIIAAIIGTSALSTNAKPGETLFPVKLAVENIQEAVTFDTSAKATLQAQHALDRLKELQANIATGNATGLSTAITNLEEKVKGAADSAQKVGNASLAKKISDDLTEVENEIDNLTGSKTTDSHDDSLLGGAKDLLGIEKDRLGAVVNPDQAKSLLKNALDKLVKVASDSAKKLDDAKKEVETAKPGVEVQEATENKQAVETHDSIIQQETQTVQTEQKTASGSGETETSGHSGSGSSGSGH